MLMAAFLFDRNGNIRARKIKLVQSIHDERVQGVICSMKVKKFFKVIIFF